MERSSNNEQPSVSRATYSVGEVAEMLGLSRRAIYDAVERGELRSVAIGRRRLIPRRVIDELLGDGAQP